MSHSKHQAQESILRPFIDPKKNKNRSVISETLKSFFDIKGQFLSLK